MKQFHLILYSLVLIVLFSACSSKGANLSKELINKNLPIVNEVKTISDVDYIAFEWDALYHNDIAGFYIYREQKGKMKLIATIKDKFKTHYVDSKLDPLTEYRYIIRTFNAQGQISQPSKIIRVRTNDVLKSVSYVQAISNLALRVKLIWRPHPDLRVTSYIIQRSDIDKNKFKTIDEIDNRLNIEYIDDDLESNVSYKYRIIAKTFNKIQSHPSGVVKATTKPLPPKVDFLHASLDAPSKIILLWDSVDYKDFLYYNIYSSSSDYLPYKLLAQTSDNKYEDIINKPDITRYYKVTMVDKDGLESLMPKDFVKGQTLALPKSPIINSAVYKNDTIELKWTKVDRAVKYIVKRYASKENAEFKDININSFEDIGLTKDKNYSYEVIAIDQYGLQSKPSSKIKVKTSAKF